MKKMLLLTAAVTLLATALSFAIARWMAGRNMPPTAAQLHDPAWLARTLSLTAEQSRAVESFEAEFRRQLSTMCATHCNARFELGDELLKPQPDLAQARAAVERMIGESANAERATLAHILKVRAVLTVEQARRYSAMIHDQVCTLPMGTP